MPPRRELAAYLGLAAMQVFAGFALLACIGLVDANPVQGALIWPLLLAAFAGVIVSVVLQSAGLTGPWDRLVIVLSAALVCLGPVAVLTRSIGGIIFTAVLAAVFFWRGMTVTRETPDYRDIMRPFGFGLAAILFAIVVLVARGQSNDQPVWQTLSLTGIAYTVTGMAVLGLTRMEEVQETGAGQTVFLAVTAQLALLVVLSLAALSLFSLSISAWLATLLAPIWNVIVLGITIVISPVGFLLNWLASHIHTNPIHPKPPPTVATPKHNPLQPHAHSGAPVGHEFFTVLAILVVALVALGLIALLVRSAPQRRRRQKNPGFTDERRSLVTPAGAWKALLAWLHKLFSRSTEAAGRVVAQTRRRVIGPSYPTDPIRRVYAQLLYRAERHGLPRSPTTTPAEFQIRLQTRWPAGSQDFVAVTDAYIRRRYGDQNPSEDEIHRVRDHWHRLREIMRPEKPA